MSLSFNKQTRPTLFKPSVEIDAASGLAKCIGNFLLGSVVGVDPVEGFKFENMTVKARDITKRVTVDGKPAFEMTAKLDENNKPVLDGAGKAVLIETDRPRYEEVTFTIADIELCRTWKKNYARAQKQASAKQAIDAEFKYVEIECTGTREANGNLYPVYEFGFCNAPEKMKAAIKERGGAYFKLDAAPPKAKAETTTASAGSTDAPAANAELDEDIPF